MMGFGGVLEKEEFQLIDFQSSCGGEYIGEFGCPHRKKLSL